MTLKTVNLPVEQALLGACLSFDRAIEIAEPFLDHDDFHGPNHGHIWQAVVHAYNSNQHIDALTIHAAMNGLVELTYLNELALGNYSISSVRNYATQIADASLRKKLVLAGAEISQLANTATDAATAADQARQLVASLDMPHGAGAPDQDIDTFINTTDTTHDWLIPDFLEYRDRCLITASEGAGKSVLLAQIAMLTAAGFHPWTLHPITPRNVLVIDLENSRRLVSRRFDDLRRRTNIDTTFDPQRLRIHCRPEGLNLVNRTDRRWLTERCRANHTELLVIGPAYRMTAGTAARNDIGGEDQAREATRALDEIRNQCNVALLMETHAPHGGITGRDLRPFGSSLWLRWPEFGIGIRQEDPDNPSTFKVEHWRGPRDKRTWPTRLFKYRNSGLLWEPEMPTTRSHTAA